MNREHADRHPGDTRLDARIAAYELAARMQLAAPEALDLSRETAAVRDRYGLDDPTTAAFSRQCLTARRLCERGVRFVQVWSGAGGASGNWDNHGDIPKELPAIARQVGLSAFRVRAWLHRFNRHGLAGLADAPRAGRPRRHDETVRGRVIAMARTKPQSLGLSFALWTLARLQQVLQERHGLGVTPATIWKWLQAEGLVWKRQQRWFQVKVDAAFVEKRGPSSRPTRSRARSGGSFASTNSDP